MRRVRTASREAIKPKLVIFAMVGIIVLSTIIAVARIVFAEPAQAVASIEITSQNRNYYMNEGGAWRVTKSAKWTAYGKAEVTFEADSILKPRNDVFTNSDTIIAININNDSVALESIMGAIEDSVDLANTTGVINDKRVGFIVFGANAQKIGLYNNYNDIRSAISTASTAISSGSFELGANYYDAFLKIDEMITENDTGTSRNTSVVIISDSIPSNGSPNEIAEFDLMIEKYPNLFVSAIQYQTDSNHFGEEIMSPIKRISHLQYVANNDNADAIIRRALFAWNLYDYQTFRITDYIDGDYFELDDDREIVTTIGIASTRVEEGAEIVEWGLGTNYVTGRTESMTIPLKVKSGAIGVADFFSTGTGIDVATFMTNDLVADNVSSSGTPILSAGYTVSYNANRPTNCTVNGMPNSQTAMPYETVQISDTIPTCNGYQFAGYEIATADALRLNSDYFKMPEGDVVLKATWTKASLSKRMDGTVYVPETLYSVIAEKTNGLDSGINFSTAPTSANGLGVNTVASTASSSYPVYYYRGNVTDNNVIFANHCWQIVRTTDTGGVKLIYNGVPINNQCITGRQSYIASTKFNTQQNSFADMGYMYGNRYTVSSMTKSNFFSEPTGQQTTVFSRVNNHQARAMFYYSSSVTYNNGQYSLVNPSRGNTLGFAWTSASSLSDSIMWKYTCASTSETGKCSEVMYVVNTHYKYNNCTLDAIKLSGNKQVSASYGDSYTVGSNGQFSIQSNTSYRATENIIRSPGSLNGKYVCWREEVGPNYNCDNMWYVSSASLDTGGLKINYKPVSQAQKFSELVSWDGSNYALSGSIKTIMGNGISELNSRHYFCSPGNSMTCTTVRFAVHADNTNIYYITLANGVASGTMALSEMSENSYNSNIKTSVDTWYENNIKNAPYANMLEDTMFCNDRSTLSSGGWIATGSLDGQISLNSHSITTPTLSCPRKADSFTVNLASGNKALTYPVGLLTTSEVIMAGAKQVSFSSYLNRLSTNIWTMTPYDYKLNSGQYVAENYLLGTDLTATTNTNKEVRPVISLKPGTIISYGYGTETDPFVIED